MTSMPDTRYSLLARLARPGDVEAWSEFVHVYEAAVFRYSRNCGLQEADAWEVVQQVLVAVHQAAADWKPSGHQGSFRAWLVETAHRVCLATLRSRARCDRATGGSSGIERLQMIAVAPQAAESRDAEHELDWQRWAFCWAAARVQHEIEPVTWRAFWLTAVDLVPPGEVAVELGMKVGSVYVAKCRVLARIRERAREVARDDFSVWNQS
jgi:RNA polymerase sigma-70 factor (ECF subfamily)